MRFLLDTNVLSEVRRPVPDAGVVAWLEELDEDRTFMSVLSIAEIRRGVALLEDGRRRQALARWLAEDLPQRFDERVLLVDLPVALAWGDLMSAAKRSGRGLSSLDGLIAATAIANDLVLVTRNVRHFEGLGIEILNPWKA